MVLSEGRIAETFIDVKEAEHLKTKAKYNTWIRSNRLLIFLPLSLLFIFLAFIPLHLYLRVLSGLIAMPFIYITCILSYSYYNSQHFGEIISQKSMI